MVPGWIGARAVKWLVVPLGDALTELLSRAERIGCSGKSTRPIPVTCPPAMLSGPSPSTRSSSTRFRDRWFEPVEFRFAVGQCGVPVGGALGVVEVSADGGHEWSQARIAAGGETWAWSLWEATVELSAGWHTIVVRATDVSGASQPATVSSTWNVKGYNNNAWHRVTIRAE